MISSQIRTVALFVSVEQKKKHAEQGDLVNFIALMVSKKTKKDVTFANANHPQAPPPLHADHHRRVHAKVALQDRADIIVAK